LEVDLGFLFPRLAWTAILLPYTSHCHWDGRHVPLPRFFLLRWGLMNFFPQAGLEQWSSQS
jgi:hypothetical protein